MGMKINFLFLFFLNMSLDNILVYLPHSCIGASGYPGQAAIPPHPARAGLFYIARV